jgi:NAD(P)-dependent dehydrogenase (short-subunit alcohol dehydrogenase family)
MAALEHLRGRTAVVTGAGSGIGRGLALHAARLGMNVVVADIDPGRLDEVAAEVRAAGASGLAVVTDVSDAAAVDRLADAAYAEFGEVALLVNNAGIESVGHVWDLSPDTWARMMRINTDGVFHGIRSFVPRMGAAPDRSHVVTMASIASVATGPLNAAYFASKHAALALTECLYLECLEGFPQLRVSVVCPSAVTTRIFEDAALADSAAQAPGQMMAWLREHVSSNGLTPEAVAETVFAGLEAGDFWILTHPEEFDALAQRRAAMLAGRTPPPLPQLA